MHPQRRRLLRQRRPQEDAPAAGSSARSHEPARGALRSLAAAVRRALAPRYALAALALFLIELAIALWVHDGFVRPYVGDVLVVPFVYCCVMAVYRGRPARTLAGVFVFACLVELAQLARLVDRLGIENHALRVIIGTTFAWEDLVAYAVGSLLTYGGERLASRRLSDASRSMSRAATRHASAP